MEAELHYPTILKDYWFCLKSSWCLYSKILKMIMPKMSPKTNILKLPHQMSCWKSPPQATISISSTLVLEHPQILQGIKYQTLWNSVVRVEWLWMIYYCSWWLMFGLLTVGIGLLPDKYFTVWDSIKWLYPAIDENADSPSFVGQFNLFDDSHGLGVKTSLGHQHTVLNSSKSWLWHWKWLCSSIHTCIYSLYHYQHAHDLAVWAKQLTT